MLIDSVAEKYWLTVDINFVEKTSEFWIVIEYFGFPNKTSAGSRRGDDRRSFSKDEIDTARDKIVEYFTGPGEKKMFPFMREDCLFLGVKFEDGWALACGEIA